MTGYVETKNIIYNILNFIGDFLTSFVHEKNNSERQQENSNTQAERIMYLYGNSILRLSYSYLHNMSDAEEILQDTIIKYIQNKPDFESGNHEKAWLLKTASNLSRNRIRYNSIRKTDELENSLASEENEDLEFVWEAVKKLSGKHREVIHLFYYEGYSVEEIAGILNRKASTVRSDLYRGRKELKNILKEAYDFD